MLGCCVRSTRQILAFVTCYLVFFRTRLSENRWFCESWEHTCADHGIHSSVNSYFSVTWGTDVARRRIAVCLVSQCVFGSYWWELLFVPPTSLPTAADPGSASALPPSSWGMLLCPSVRDSCLLNRWIQALPRGLRDFYFVFFSPVKSVPQHTSLDFRAGRTFWQLLYWTLDCASFLLRLSNPCNTYCFLSIFGLVLLSFQWRCPCRPCVLSTAFRFSIWTLFPSSFSFPSF